MIDDHLKQIIKKVEDDSRLDDEPTKRLVADLGRLLTRALDGAYHDFHPNGVATPKMELHKDLMGIDDKMQRGEYDN